MGPSYCDLHKAKEKMIQETHRIIYYPFWKMETKYWAQVVDPCFAVLHMSSLDVGSNRNWETGASYWSRLFMSTSLQASFMKLKPFWKDLCKSSFFSLNSWLVLEMGDNVKQKRRIIKSQKYFSMSYVTLLMNSWLKYTYFWIGNWSNFWNMSIQVWLDYWNWKVFDIYRDKTHLWLFNIC